MLSQNASGMQTSPVRPCCLPRQHHWQPTWSAGEFVCLRCGRRVLCPMCVVVLPRTPVVLHACLRHRMEEASSSPSVTVGGQA